MNRFKSQLPHKSGLPHGRCWLHLLVAIAPLILFVGCSNVDHSSDRSSSKPKLPKLKFHRPKTAAAAAGRLREIHDSLVADADLPKPIKFSVVEIIHGEGRSSHSHYYLESNWDSASADHHEDMVTTKKLHQLEIDVFTELEDIVAWTPNIAAAADLTEADWETVNRSCQAMEKLLAKQIDAAEGDQEKRKAYRSNAPAFGELISQLEFLRDSQDQK